MASVITKILHPCSSGPLRPRAVVYHESLHALHMLLSLITQSLSEMGDIPSSSQMRWNLPWLNGLPGVTQLEVAEME